MGKVVVKAQKVFLKVGKAVKRHAKLMKIKVHVRPKDCKCAPKKAHKKIVKHVIVGKNGHGVTPKKFLPKITVKKHVIVGKNGHGIPPKKFLPKKKTTKITAKKHVIVGKNGHGIPPKKFLPKKTLKLTAKKHVIVGKNGHGVTPKKFLPKAKVAK